MKISDAFDCEATLDHLLDGNADLKLELFIKEGKEKAKYKALEFLVQLERKIMRDIDDGFEEDEWVTDPRKYFFICHDKLFQLSEDFIRHTK